MSGDRYDQLESRIGYRFANRDLLRRALTHASYGDGRRPMPNYERLEFLGDRVLGLIAARKLFDAFEEADEGGLAPRYNALVRKEACARVARRFDLGEALLMSKSEDKAGGRDKDRILGDACEALLAAIYLDGGLQRAQGFFSRFWRDELKALTEKPKDPKTRLQEWALERGMTTPRYRVVDRSGPDHRPRFTVIVSAPPLEDAMGEGGSKQDAERAAAAALIERELEHG